MCHLKGQESACFAVKNIVLQTDLKDLESWMKTLENS